MRKLAAAAILFLACGCMGVRPETQAEISKLNSSMNALAAQLEQLGKLHEAGKLTTKQLETEAAPVLEKIKEVQAGLRTAWQKAEEEGSNKWGVGAQIAMTMAAIAVARILGIPGLASASGGNLFQLGRHLLTMNRESGK